MRSEARNQVVFGVFAAIMIGALGLISVLMLTLERNEAESRRDARLQDAIGAALERMESRLTPILSREDARPYFHYASFYAADEAYTRMLNPVEAGDVLVPSPLLSEMPEFCRLHFQIGADGSFTSPRVPSENLLDIAETKYLTDAEVHAAAGALVSLRGCIEGPELVVAMCGDMRFTNYPAIDTWGTSEPGIEVGTMSPRWIDREGAPELVIVRSLVTPRTKFVQGVWLEWSPLCASLLEEVSDLLPNARLERALLESDASIADDEPTRLVAGLPVALVPGSIPSTHNSVFTPMRMGLAVAWIAVLASIMAVGFVVRALVDLGDRRGRFVSAVTHELRTPLTTFRLYSHMLADGTVRDESTRREFIDTLRSESDRLQRVVENVLSYARLGDTAGGPRMKRIDAHELVSGILPVLERRIQEQEMRLESALDGVDGTQVLADTQSLERVLVNLVDNACRYAGDAPETTDRRIHILTARHSQSISISVADHGPGITPADGKRIFKSFARAHEQNGAQSGLGLGLALARELTRQHGGDLRLESRESFGAVFSITLPTVGALP